MQSQTENLQIFSYTDSELNLSDTEQYQLDVTISAYRLAFTISLHSRVLAYKYVTAKENLLHAERSVLQHCTDLLGWDSQHYKQIRVFIQHELFTLVPEALFDASQVEGYLSLVHKLPSNHETLAVSVTKHHALCVFALPVNLLQYIKQLFNPSLIAPQALVLLKIAEQFNQHDLKQRLIVDIEERFITMLYYQNNEIAYLNTFTTQADTDITYFVLSVAELLKLSPDKCGLYLLGNVSVTSSTIGLLKKYIPEVIPISRMNAITYPASFREFQEQQHYLPIHSLLCE